MNVRLVILLGLSTAACSSVSPNGATQERTGEDALQGGYAWGGDYAVGMIGFASGGVCTGTLISPTVVLTAGHCIQNAEITGFYTGAGAPIATSAEDPVPQAIPSNLRKYVVDGVALYPGFDVAQLLSHGPSKAAPDLGVLHLATAVTGIVPARVPSGPDASAAATSLVSGKVCWAIGYGRHDVAGVTTVKEKRTAEIQIASVSDMEITTHRTTFSQNGIGDEGDSGGPLLCAIPGTLDGWPWRVVGTVSYSRDVPDTTSAAHENHQEEFYVRVDRYADWINGAIQTFPVEERCAIANGALTTACKGQELRYCDGARWRPMQTCATGKVCDAAAMRCN
jgi:hypothetical protein